VLGMKSLGGSGRIVVNGAGSPPRRDCLRDGLGGRKRVASLREPGPYLSC